MKRVRFPKRIKRGSHVVTIYLTQTKGYPLFAVADYRADGGRCRQSFADYSFARKTAVDVATKLSGGESDMLVLAGQELLVYRRAFQALKIQWREPRCGGTPLPGTQGNNGNTVATIVHPTQSSIAPLWMR